MTNTEPTRSIHHGRNVKLFREARKMKIETLADILGMPVNNMANIEDTKELDPALIDVLAKALKVNPSAIKNTTEEFIINNIQNNYEGSSTSNTGSGSFAHNVNCSFNTLEKYGEALDKVEKLYEALLKSEREKNALLEKLIEKLEKK